MKDFDILDFSYMREAFVGQTRELKDCETHLDSIIEHYKQTPSINLNKHESTFYIEEYLREKFGFKKIIIYWSNGAYGDTSTVVGYNFIKSIVSSNDDYQLEDNKGYYDRKHEMKVIININKSIIDRYTNITGAHILALILMEIGHNFNTSSYNILKGICAIFSQSSSLILTELMTSNTLKGFTNTINQLLSKLLDHIPPLKFLFRKLSYLTRAIKDITGSIYHSSGAVFLASIFGLILVDPIKLFERAFGRMSYAESAKFVATYGYGKELSEMIAMEETRGYTGKKDIMKRNLLTRIVYDLSLGFIILNQNICSGSLSHNTLTIKQIEKLKGDLDKGDFRPELKEILESEISELENYFDNYNKQSDQDKLMFSKLINEMLS